VASRIRIARRIGWQPRLLQTTVLKLRLDELNKGTISPTVLSDVLSSVHAPVESPFSSMKDSDLKTQSISDAVCISSAHSAQGLDHLFYSIESLATKLLARGFFIRGAVVKGLLYHDTSKVFGQALVRAYQFESNVARYAEMLACRRPNCSARGRYCAKPLRKGNMARERV
jgi:hypothetical protein